MSKVQLAGNASGTGIFTIASPNSNVDRTLTLPDNTGTLLTSGSAIQRSQMYAGAVLQVVQVVKTDVTSGTSQSQTDVAGLSLTITPSSATSKILFIANINGVGTALNNHLRLSILRNGTQIAFGDAAGVRKQLSSWSYNSDSYAINSSMTTFLDSPSTTSAVTYKIQASTEGGTWYINRSSGDPDNTTSGRVISTITAMEIAA